MTQDDVIKKLRLYMAENDLNQAEFAEDIRTHPNIVSRVMTKKIQPTRDMLKLFGLKAVKYFRFEEINK